MINRKAPLVSAAACAGLAVILVAHVASGTRSLLPTAARPAGSGTGSGQSRSSTSSGGSSSSSQVSGSTTGKIEQYGYGELSVSVSVSHGKITQLNMGRLLTADSYSQQLAQQVIPMLRNEVLSAQSAQISGISGATYTSEAYAMSVQSALDKLHVK